MALKIFRGEYSRLRTGMMHAPRGRCLKPDSRFNPTTHVTLKWIQRSRHMEHEHNVLDHMKRTLGHKKRKLAWQLSCEQQRVLKLSVEPTINGLSATPTVSPKSVTTRFK